MTNIQVHVLDISPGGQIQATVSVQYGGFSSSCETWFNPMELPTFAKQLVRFPASSVDECSLVIGSRDLPGRVFLELRAFCFDYSGHTALEVRMEDSSPPPKGYRSLFYAPLPAATINRLGTALALWSSSDDLSDFEFSDT